MKPLLLLDVDGVLNAVTQHSDQLAKTTGWNDWRQVTVAGYPILAAEPVLDFIRRVHADDMAEVRWLTTWEKGDLVLSDLTPALDLPTFPIAGRARNHAAEAFSDYGYWWKFGAIQVVAAEQDRRIVWVDDDFPFSREATAWVDDRAGRVLGLSPSTEVGLTAHDLDRIETFLTDAGESE